ncbi:MAG: sensor histidine kinase [Magnetospiraceae bacterium]
MASPTEEPLIKRLLPHSLLGRSLLIIVAPLVLLQVVSALIFYENHWDNVSRRLSLALAGDIGAVMQVLQRDPGPETILWIRENMVWRMNLRLTVSESEFIAAPGSRPEGRTMDIFARALERRLDHPYSILFAGEDIVIRVGFEGGVATFETVRKRLYSHTTYIFIMWMVGTSVVLFGVAVVFMRNQVRPIRRLALAADRFGRGIDMPAFKPEGAAEVRQAAIAFMRMKDRIQRYVGERTRMLAGVSHDLRTPLTRMKLQVAMLRDTEATEELTEDIQDMERMLNGYLTFARGEGLEEPVVVDLCALTLSVIEAVRRSGAQISFDAPDELLVALKPDALKRCLNNLIENAVRYGSVVFVTIWEGSTVVEILIDDNGPGIAKDDRENVFRPFHRLEESRNPDTGGVGLGLSIARDIARSHGGDISIDESPSGGARFRVGLPL